MTESKPMEETTAAANGDLMSQARKLRQTRSTAEIILEEEPPRFSRKAIIYTTLATICLVVLLYIFLAPAPRQTLQNRTGDFAQALASDQPSRQAATPANAYTPPPAPDGVPVLPADPVGPYHVPAAGAPPAPAVTSVPAPAPKPPAAARVERTAPSVTAPATPAPRKTPSASAESKGVPADARPAYTLLLELRPALGGMLRGDLDEVRHLGTAARAKENGVYVFDLEFQEGSAGDRIHYLWEVDPAARTVKPIGLAAAKFDRQQLRNR